ncbi:MAG: glutamate--tRNA ligase [Deltaproteobacteria bacterium]|nr:glutamate--tRNA ligase [Deltaproteobacteria bacterium]
MSQDIRVRFAPSPTGYLHVGGVRTAIFNHLFARHHGGRFVLRIEDTDKERSTPEAVEQILDSLRWIGLDWDEEPVFQSQRTELYRKHLDRLLEEGKAYRCTCKAEDLDAKRQKAIAEKRTYKYDGTCRELDPKRDLGDQPFVVRFKTPWDALPDSFTDLVLGTIPIDEERLDDMILARSDGSATYNFCVVVDDADMGISHVIRGNDHLDNTPKQLLIYEALGLKAPKFAHMPLTHGPDGSKLSKRREEEYRALGISVSVQEYRHMGYLPHALVNYLTRLGWSHGDQEIFSREELEKLFDLDGVGKSAGIIDPDKLKWLNSHYIQEEDTDRLSELLLPLLIERGHKAEAGPRLDAVVETLKPRAKTLVDMAEQALFYYQAPTEYDPKAVKKWWKANAAEILVQLREMVSKADLDDGEAVEENLRKLADALVEGKLGKVAQPLRVAISGSSATPSLFAVLGILGKEETLQRIDRALAELAKRD